MKIYYIATSREKKTNFTNKVTNKTATRNLQPVEKLFLDLVHFSFPPRASLSIYFFHVPQKQNSCKIQVLFQVCRSKHIFQNLLELRSTSDFRTYSHTQIKSKRSKIQIIFKVCPSERRFQKLKQRYSDPTHPPKSNRETHIATASVSSHGPLLLTRSATNFESKRTNNIQLLL